MAKQKQVSQKDHCIKTVTSVVLDKFKYLFEVIDLVFLNLYIIWPTKKEKDDTAVSITKERIWEDLEFSEPPKLHILFLHTMEQVIEFGIFLIKIKKEWW